MKSFVWLGLMLALLAGHAGAAQNAPPSIPLVSSGPCGGSAACPGVPNDSTHWFYGFDPTVNANVQALLTALGQPLTINLPSGIATSALQTAGNASLVTIATASASQATAAKQDAAQTSLTAIAASVAAGPTGTGQTTANTSLSTIATAQGTQGTGSTFNPPTGGSGILGYLSGIYKAITGTLTITGSVTTTPVSTATQTTNTITAVAITATSGTLIAANANRKSLSFMNIGANSCTVTTVNPAVSGSGAVYASGGPFPSQGGSNQYDSKVPTNAYYAICPTGLSTTFSVEEGN